MPKRKTKEEFINDAKKIWGDQFDYSKVEYVNGRTEVIIHCKKHNIDFKQSPFVHTVSKHNGCPKCQEETQRMVSQQRRLSFDEFKKRCYEKFGNSIDVSMSVYKGMGKNIIAICKNGHGAFSTTPSSLLNSKYGCGKCSATSRANSSKITKEEFLYRANNLFGHRFIYDKSIYNGYLEPIEIECNKHGNFTTTPKSHLRTENGGCLDCYSERMQHVNSSMTPEQYIEKAKEVWGNEYCYDKTDYKSYKKSITIHCNKHNYDFERLPKSLLNGAGCPLCEDEDFVAFEERKKILQNERAQIRDRIKWKRQRSKEVWNLRPKRNNWNVNEFIRLAKLIHEDDYDYERAVKDYKDQQRTPVNIYCKRHKYYFEQTPDKHLLGQGCPKCIGRHRTTEEFKEEATFLFQEKYDYSDTIYQGCSKKVKVFCRKHKQYFRIQPSKHLEGEGCPICSASSLENELIIFLKQSTKILFIKQKQFDWLKTTRTMPLDIYIPRFNLAIECQGMQHFSPSTLFGGNSAFDKQLKRDQIKYELCKQHGITIWYYASTTYNVPDVYHDKVFTKLSDLLKELKNLEVIYK